MIRVVTLSAVAAALAGLLVLGVPALSVAGGFSVSVEDEVESASTGSPLRALHTDTVSCGTTATSIADNLSGSARSMLMQNTSATAINIGGADVTTSKGIQVCDGCTAGKTFSVDTREAHCVVASGTVNLEVIWGN